MKNPPFFNSSPTIQKHTKESTTRVYSIGGDGTLNEVLNGMIGENCTLAAIPAGSGNDFIKSLISEFDTADILKKTISGKETKIEKIIFEPGDNCEVGRNHLQDKFVSL